MKKCRHFDAAGAAGLREASLEVDPRISPSPVFASGASIGNGPQKSGRRQVPVPAQRTEVSFALALVSGDRGGVERIALAAIPSFAGATRLDSSRVGFFIGGG